MWIGYYRKLMKSWNILGADDSTAAFIAYRKDGGVEKGYFVRLSWGLARAAVKQEPWAINIHEVAMGHQGAILERIARCRRDIGVCERQLEQAKIELLQETQKLNTLLAKLKDAET